MKSGADSSDFARLDELRKIMINARAAFHGLAEDVKMFVEIDFADTSLLSKMKVNLAECAATYVHAVERYQKERAAIIGRIAKDDPRRPMLGVEVVKVTS
jgi:hypothetical protein